MGHDKYHNLGEKGPEEAAKIVGVVEKRNYLAHSIREIELAILRTQHKHYQVITYKSEVNANSEIYFFDKCCEIRLANTCDQIDERKLRLILAHELGHLVKNINKLGTAASLKTIKYSNEEEIFAWEFAFHLIHEKSEEYKSSIKRNSFVYSDKELKKSLTSILEKNKPEILSEVMKSIGK